MCCAIVNCFPRAMVKYKFVDRNDTVYPEGFGELVMEQIAYLENLRFTEEEEFFMRERCYYIPTWFYTYLRGFRFKREWVKLSKMKKDVFILKLKAIGMIPYCWKL